MVTDLLTICFKYGSISYNTCWCAVYRTGDELRSGNLDWFMLGHRWMNTASTLSKLLAFPKRNDSETRPKMCWFDSLPEWLLQIFCLNNPYGAIWRGCEKGIMAIYRAVCLIGMQMASQHVNQLSYIRTACSHIVQICQLGSIIGPFQLYEKFSGHTELFMTRVTDGIEIITLVFDGFDVILQIQFQSKAYFKTDAI